MAQVPAAAEGPRRAAPGRAGHNHRGAAVQGGVGRREEEEEAETGVKSEKEAPCPYL